MSPNALNRPKSNRLEKVCSKRNDVMASVLLIHKAPDEFGDLVRLILGRCGAAVRTEPFDLGLDGIEPAAKAAELDPPDLLILDSELLSDEQYHRLKEIPALKETPVLFIDAKPHDMVDSQVKRLGVNGYILTPFGPQELTAAYEAVLRGETYYPPLPDKT